jgi:hypothetical protein
MNTNLNSAVFPQTVTVAINNLKHQLQHSYELAYPELHEIIHLVLDEEESRARELTSFPHLVLPDLVEAHIAQLNLRPANTRPRQILTSRRDTKNTQPSPNEYVPAIPAWSCA